MSKGGIDYGMGLTNIDPKTGIRFGVVHQNKMGDGFFESVASEYFQGCPNCGTELSDEQRDKLEAKMKTINGRLKGKCPHCNDYISPDDIHGEEPIGQYIKQDGIEASIDSLGDIFITKSPFYTRGTFCSPCAPGAVSIGPDYQTTNENHPRAYCFPDSWYSDKPKMGNVFRTADDTQVKE